jgi:uncharacterized membrane protein
MGWIRKFLWIAGGLILGITFITMVSQVYWEGLGWDGINLNAYLFGYIFGVIFIASMFVFDILSFSWLRSGVHQVMDETEQITPEKVARILDEPLWRVLPIFRKREAPGILIVQSGKYMHFNESFQEKLFEQYAEGKTIGELAHNLNLSKNEINLILDECDYKGILPEVKTPTDRPKQDQSTKGLRKTVRLRKKYKKKRR